MHMYNSIFANRQCESTNVNVLYTILIILITHKVFVCSNNSLY